jgi:hypothetical protein
MEHDTQPIHVAPDSDLARLLDVAYDLEAVRAALRASAGLLTPTATERLKAAIYQAREDGTRPEKCRPGPGI